MGDGKCNPRIHFYMYAMSQLCVKVMVDDEEFVYCSFSSGEV